MFELLSLLLISLGRGYKDNHTFTYKNKWVNDRRANKYFYSQYKGK